MFEAILIGAVALGALSPIKNARIPFGDYESYIVSSETCSPYLSLAPSPSDTSKASYVASYMPAVSSDYNQGHYYSVHDVESADNESRAINFYDLSLTKIMDCFQEFDDTEKHVFQFDYRFCMTSLGYNSKDGLSMLDYFFYVGESYSDVPFNPSFFELVIDAISIQNVTGSGDYRATITYSLNASYWANWRYGYNYFYGYIYPFCDLDWTMAGKKSDILYTTDFETGHLIAWNNPSDLANTRIPNDSRQSVYTGAFDISFGNIENYNYFRQNFRPYMGFASEQNHFNQNTGKILNKVYHGLTYTYTCLTPMVNSYIVSDNYQAGYDQGYDVGYQYGFEKGLQETQTMASVKYLNNAFAGLANILNIQLFPGITIGFFVFVPLVLGVVCIFIKFLH